MLSPVDRVQALRLWFMMARHADMAFYQFEKGLLPEDRLNSALAVFLFEDTATPIYKAFWAEPWGPGPRESGPIRCIDGSLRHSGANRKISKSNRGHIVFLTSD